MLSLKVISPKQGETYYQEENYYSEEEANENSEWQGAGAAKLKLSGKISGKTFKKLLNGELPNGQKLTGKMKSDNRRAGIDLTFSAPKSVSIAALVGERADIERAHQEAVTKALEIIEERYIQARISTPEGRRAIRTGNAIIAKYHHDTSRAKDPQLHTHCVVINGTQLKSGKWRAIHNDLLFKNKMLLGQIYRNELANKLQQLGYEIEQKEKGLFELKGYSEEQLNCFSKRSQQIKELVGKNATAKEKELANLKTRVAKDKEVNRNDLIELWQQEAAMNKIIHPLNIEFKAKKKSLSLILQDAIDHCAERNCNFQSEDIEKFALLEAGEFSFSQLEKAIKNHQALIKTNNNEFTTNKALDRELNTIDLINRGKGQAVPILYQDQLNQYLDDISLTKGQKSAIEIALTTRDKYLAWQGVAGAGKTCSL